MLNLLNSLLKSTPLGVDQQQTGPQEIESMSAQPPETKAESPDIDLRPICVKCKVHFCDNSEICNDCDDTRVKSEDYGPDDEIIGIKAEPLSSDDEAAIAVAIMESIEMPEPDDNPTAKQAAPAEKGSKPEVGINIHGVNVHIDLTDYLAG